MSFATPYIANPDLVERFRFGASLAEPDWATFYGGDHHDPSWISRFEVVETT